MLIDTHAHLNFSAFEKDVKNVIQRSLENDVWMINIGTQYDTSEKAVKIADGYKKGVYAAIGLHPLHLEEQKLDKSEVESLSKFKTRAEEFNYERYKKLAKSEKVVAVGEIGLDYYYKPKTKRKLEIFKQKQREALLSQLRLAQELDLPVIFHCRMAHRDLIEFLLKSPEVRPEKAAAHGFVGNIEELKKYLDFGFYIGFNGIIFKLIEGINFEENIRYTPLDKILIETDCPYLIPPQAGDTRNEPLYVKYIAERIAQIKNLSHEKIAEITAQNAKYLFRLSTV